MTRSDIDADPGDLWLQRRRRTLKFRAATDNVGHPPGWIVDGSYFDRPTQPEETT